ncbi:MAG: P-loop NTPase [Solirubrobacteraceae bacterium]
MLSRWWLILVAVIVATGGVYAYYSHKPDVYDASTLVYYQDPGDVVTGTPSQPQTDRTVEDAATLLDSRATAVKVAAELHYSGTPQSLLGQVTIGSRSASDFIQVSAQAGSAAQAAAITNAFAATLVSTLSNGVTLQILSAIRLSESQLAATPKTLSNAGQISTLQQQISRLQLSLKVPTLVSRQVDQAQPPTSPTSPKPVRDALFAFILSLIGAIALCYGLERFDRRLKNPEEMEAAYGRALLAVLPHSDQPISKREDEPALGFDFREPFRILRTNIELESLDSPPRTIVVSSAMPGEGKSTVVRNMALAFRETGKRVAVVDLDLRNPGIHRLFGVPKRAGVTEVLRHDITLEEASLPIQVGLDPVDQLFRQLPAARATRTGADDPASAGGSGNGHGASNGHKWSAPHAEITLICGGARPANAPAVLASERLVEVLDELKSRFDLVLIDSAPLLVVSDTVPLLRYADAAVFVGRLDVTTRDTAKRLMEFIARVPDLNLLGVVANDLSRIDAAGYGYGYGYGYGAYREQPETHRGRRRRAFQRQREKEPV